jgi:hypothetical protein
MSEKEFRRLASLTSEEILARLAILAEEEDALRALLRAARAREKRAQGREVKHAS